MKADEITNEEIAVQIANKEKKYYGNPQYEMRDEYWSVHECYKSAMQAMKWKDEQFNNFLNTLNMQSNSQHIYFLIKQYQEEHGSI